jgi:hypothetical protein
MAVYKREEYAAFIKLINGGRAAHWYVIANAIGIDKNTVTAWKKLPEARKAIINGIDHALDHMEQAGKNDWRMWESKLKMLGADSKVSPDSIENPIDIILRSHGLIDENHNPNYD